MKFGVEKVPRSLKVVDILSAIFWIWLGTAEETYLGSDTSQVLKVLFWSFGCVFLVQAVLHLFGKHPFITFKKDTGNDDS